MMTVRFATGFSIQYNTATFVERGEHYCDLRTAKGGQIIAQVPTQGCVIELVPACCTYHAGDSEIKQSLENAAKSVRSLTRKINKVAK